MAQLKHGMSKHPLYTRWNALVTLCYNSKSKDYPNYGGKGIRLVEDWHPENGKGVENFINWLEKELTKHPGLTAYYICRHDKNKHYGPQNCYLSSIVESVQASEAALLTFDAVVAARRFARANPKTTLAQLCLVFGGKPPTMSEALRGITWSNVDVVEPPLPTTGRVNNNQSGVLQK